jgi:Putative MetA-pathway of phenol degradation
MAKILWATILFLFGTCVQAQVEKIDTDRPDQTESVNTVPKNYFQAEFGFNKENTFYDNYDLIYPTALFKYGLKKFEFRLVTTIRSSYEHLISNPKWVNGIDPVEVGFKAALWEEKKLLPKTSFIFHLGLPILVSKKFRTDHIAPSFVFTMQHSLTENIGLGYNLGAAWDGFSSMPGWIYTISPGFNIGEKWYAYFEVFGFIQKNEMPQHNLDGGLAYYISNDIKIDISGGFGISNAAPKSYVAIGFSFRFKTSSKK